MKRGDRRRKRKGANLVETVIISLLLWTLLFTVVVVGLGVFREQQMAYLAREGARWASVHGAQYASDTKLSAATASDVYNNAILPRAAALDTTQLSYSVSWNSNNSRTYTYKDTKGVSHTVINTVSVTVSYNWVPEVFYGGTTLKSTSVMPMSY